jgi:hypothetical protein
VGIIDGVDGVSLAAVVRGFFQLGEIRLGHCFLIAQEALFDVAWTEVYARVLQYCTNEAAVISVVDTLNLYLSAGGSGLDLGTDDLQLAAAAPHRC